MRRHISEAHPANITECRLHNASYTAFFLTSNGVTRVTANRTLVAPLSVHMVFHKENDGTPIAATHEGFAEPDVEHVFQHQLTVGASERGNCRRRCREHAAADRFRFISLQKIKAAFIPVNVTSYLPTQRCLPRDLWISYGVAIATTLFAAAIGLHAAWVSGSSYSSKLPTAIRVAKHTGPHSLLSSESDDNDGSDPLPKAVAKVCLEGSQKLQ